MLKKELKTEEVRQGPCWADGDFLPALQSTERTSMRPKGHSLGATAARPGRGGLSELTHRYSLGIYPGPAAAHGGTAGGSGDKGTSAKSRAGGWDSRNHGQFPEWR